LNLDYHRLILAAGSVNKLLPIPGVAPVSPSTHAHDLRGVAEALYLRDHIIRQVELAAASDDAAEREARCTFVVVGAGYTGTEVATQGPLFTTAIAKRHRELRGQKMGWLLLDVAPKVMPELDARPSRAADRVLRRRGVEVLLWRVRPGALARVVRGCPSRPLGGPGRTRHAEGQARGRPHAHRSRPPRAEAVGDARRPALAGNPHL
jgi:NADH dehydrogenase FAD-containing subunit